MIFTRLVSTIFADGEWHSANELYEATQHLVPPERAIKRCRLEKEGGPSDIDLSVRRGKWRVVQYLLANHVWKKRIEGRGEGVNREYRLRNGYPNAKSNSQKTSA